MISGQQPVRALPFKQAFPWVGFVAAMFLVTYLDRTMFGPLLGLIETEFDISHSQSAALLLYISIGYATSTFLSAFTSTWVSPQKMVGLAIIACGIILLVMAGTKNYLLFCCLFVALGFASGQYFNAGLSTMRSLVLPADWGKAISIHELGPTCGFIFGPLLAALASALPGWRDVLLVMGCVSVLAGILFYWKGKGGSYTAQPVSFKGIGSLLKKPMLWLFAWIFALGIAGEFAPYSILSLYMEKELHYAPGFSKLLLSGSRLLPVIAVLSGGYLVAKFSTRPVLLWCLGLNALGMFLMAAPWMPLMVAGMFIQPIATAVTFPPMFTLLAENFSPEEQPLLIALSTPPASAIGGGLIPNLLGVCGDIRSFSDGFILLGILLSVTVFLVMKATATTQHA